LEEYGLGKNKKMEEARRFEPLTPRRVDVQAERGMGGEIEQGMGMSSVGENMDKGKGRETGLYEIGLCLSSRFRDGT
jgi:hypothetical protein